MIEEGCDVLINLIFLSPKFGSNPDNILSGESPNYKGYLTHRPLTSKKRSFDHLNGIIVFGAGGWMWWNGTLLIAEPWGVNGCLDYMIVELY